ncbi:MAG: condensation domain-containing protein [Nostoc sp.]|uniref:condensation domain-containing protein n=1 Tax=Nostoc sp. TaxID=1180 RepID=UPI002FFD31E2
MSEEIIINRQLGKTEHVIWLVDQIFPFNGVVGATITGTLSIPQLIEALAQIQQRHPLLRVSIDINQEEQPCFISDNSSKIPLQVVMRQSENDWCQVAAEELAKPFKWNKSPLIRAVLLHSFHVSDLMFTFHHSIGDGLSVVYLIEEVLQQINSPNTRLQPLPFYPPYEELVPHLPQGSNKDSLMQESENYKIPNSNLLIELNEKNPSLDWQVGLLSWKLSSHETSQLILRCREEQTSLHGVICAAFFISISEEIALEKETFIKCFSPCNLRQYLKASIEKDFGLYLALILTTEQVKDLDNFWEAARKIKFEINQAISQGKIFGGIPGIEQFLANKPDPIAMRQYLIEKVPTQIFVSNLGDLKISSQFGSFQLQNLYITGPGLTFEPFFIGAVTINGIMCITLRYLKSIITPDVAERISLRAMQQIRKAFA